MVWAVCLLLLSFPFMLVVLVVLGWSVTASGLDPASDAGRARLADLNWVFLAVSSLPLIASVVVGWRAWQRGRRGGLVVAVLAAVALLGFLVLPTAVRFL